MARGRLLPRGSDRVIPCEGIGHEAKQEEASWARLIDTRFAAISDFLAGFYGIIRPDRDWQVAQSERDGCGKEGLEGNGKGSLPRPHFRSGAGIGDNFRSTLDSHLTLRKSSIPTLHLALAPHRREQCTGPGHQDPRRWLWNCRVIQKQIRPIQTCGHRKRSSRQVVGKS